MKILKYILFTLIGLFILSAIAGFFLPSKVHVERQAEFNAPAYLVFNQFNTVENWIKWFPWVKMDTHSKWTHFGPDAGIGAGYSWKGEKTGEGKITITESKPFSLIVTELEMGDKKGYPGFLFEEINGTTRVTWYFDNDAGSNPFSRYMNLMIKGMLGHLFEQGLSDVKNIIDSLPPIPPPVKTVIEEINSDSAYLLTITDTASPEFLRLAYFENLNLLRQEAEKQQLEITGQPSVIYFSITDTLDTISVVIPTNKKGRNTKTIKAAELPSQKEVVAHYFGDFRLIQKGRDAVLKYAGEKGLLINGPLREQFISGPETENDTANWQTDIYYPVQ
ncbi:MAG: SRPBCC family protein [Bacteroidia bacterium]|nr:SRPBCC family protein [Bacteroidia bacterium]MCZ2277578.1 SRPBCC family protein [Bacteroidia bacterium]